MPSLDPSEIELEMYCAQLLKRQWPTRRSYSALLTHPAWPHKNSSQEALDFT